MQVLELSFGKSSKSKQDEIIISAYLHIMKRTLLVYCCKSNVNQCKMVASNHLLVGIIIAKMSECSVDKFPEKYYMLPTGHSLSFEISNSWLL